MIELALFFGVFLALAAVLTGMGPWGDDEGRG